MGMTESQKARAYDTMRPGVNIPEGQKAERYDREAIAAKHGGKIAMVQGARRRRAHVGRMVVGKVWPGHPDYEKE